MKVLKELRIKKGITQQEVSDYLGLTRAAYTNIENGKRETDFSTLVKLAFIFDVSTDYLLGNSDDPTPPNATEQEKPPTNWELFEREFIRTFGREPTDLDIDRALHHLRVDDEFHKKHTD